MNLALIQSLAVPGTSRILLVVLDGVGGLPGSPGGPTELEAADTPNLDRLASEGACGLHEPVGPGITPGSGPGHLGLFGYDPLKYHVGRGALSALGVDFDLREGDLAARGNFATVDDDGVVTDRRAGRISTEANSALCRELGEIELPDVSVYVEPVKEHRFLLVLRGKGLHDGVNDTDPHVTGKKPREPKAESPEARETAALLGEFVEKAAAILKEKHPANAALLRGFALRPDWPSFTEVTGLRSAAIASYPMYRGIANLLGMDLLSETEDLDAQVRLLEEEFANYDFIFFHVKKTDSAGEDGDAARKRGEIETVDALMPRMMDLKPDVLVVTGDHSTPASMKSHSWHPVPVLLWSGNARPDRVQSFGERPCMAGTLGPRMRTCQLLPWSATPRPTPTADRACARASCCP